MVVSVVGNTGNIYVVTTEGKVLKLGNGTWSELPNSCGTELRMKRISCTSSSLWAICGDHQVYLRLESDVPIRVREESYENQRWNPVDGFCNKLLPTDRPFYSTQDGLTDRDFALITLPTPSWVWDDQWHLELICDGQHLETDGWTYSVDFPRTYTPSKGWNSCVRRRKWVRNRRYNGLQSWVCLPPLILNEVMEPFIDVASGGHQMPGAVPGFVAVWAVTINGLLLFRRGVNLTTCPEGEGWIQVETPKGHEPCQVSVSPTGIVWILAWNGQILARNGINWNQETGTSWFDMPPPFQGVTFSHISVGIGSAWAVSREKQIWMRKGLQESSSSGVLGSSWTSMVGKMDLVFTGSDSQVCGLLLQDQKLYLRTGIKTEESGGKAWKMVKSEEKTGFTWMAFDGQGFVMRLEESNESNCSEPWREKILSKLRERQDRWEDKFPDYPIAIESSDWVKSGRAMMNHNWVNLSLRCNQDPLLHIEDLRLSAVEITAVRCKAERFLAIHSLLHPPIRLQFVSEQEVEDWAAHLTQVTRTSRNCSGIFARATWALSNTGDPYVHESRSSAITSTTDYEMEMDTGTHSSLFVHDVPPGFHRGCTITVSGGVPSDAKRFSVYLQCGPKLLLHEIQAGTVKRDICLHINPRFETISKGSVEVIRNTFANNMWDVEEKTGHFDLDLGSRFTLSVQCLRQHYLVNINGESFTFAHRMSPFSATHLVIKGDVNVFNVTYKVPGNSNIPAHALWTQVGGHFRHAEANVTGIVWALGHDGTCWIHTGCHGGAFFKGVLGNQHGVHPITDEGFVDIWENQRWNPVAGFAARGLPTDRSNWSDVTGRITCNKESMSLPNRHWTWISDWLVDYHPPDGADREGWQYSTDFPNRYHPHKGSFDYVRRKRWKRKCRFTSTGPWFQFGLTKLLDVSMQVDHSGKPEEPVLLWAIAANGSILRRVGVTVMKPQGDSWEAVMSEHAFQSISIGCYGRVWAVTSLGAPTLRHRVTEDNPDGAAWLLLDRPEGNPTLRQISAGDGQVWAVDTLNRLYRRKDIVNILPEGTSWEMVEEHVLHVSVDKHDQVWAVLDIGAPGIKEKGTICSRQGITASCPAGTGWEFVIGGGWSFICNRGYDIPPV